VFGLTRESPPIYDPSYGAYTEDRESVDAGVPLRMSGLPAASFVGTSTARSQSDDLGVSNFGYDASEPQELVPDMTGFESPLKWDLSMRNEECYTCRLRGVKCEVLSPVVCQACYTLDLPCDYQRPMWWSNSEERRRQKRHIDDAVKRSQLSSRLPIFQGYSGEPSSIGVKEPRKHQNFLDAPRTNQSELQSESRFEKTAFVRSANAYDKEMLGRMTPRTNQSELQSESRFETTAFVRSANAYDKEMLGRMTSQGK
jgi:hypothetical protein